MSCGQSGIYIYLTSVVSLFLLLLLHTFCMEPLLTRSGAIVFLSPGEAGISGGRHGRAHQSKPEPDTPLLKNKVNHNMCSGLFKKEEKKTPTCKRGEGETSFSCFTVKFWLAEKVDVVHLIDTRDLCFRPFFVCFLFWKVFRSLLWHSVKVDIKAVLVVCFDSSGSSSPPWPPPFWNSAKW